jgi:hypothetical protein
MRLWHSKPRLKRSFWLTDDESYRLGLGPAIHLMITIAGRIHSKPDRAK